tara:strand:+ start:490 stop:708 length:219 start_codon:yes stop_codon:yes gene_type:complete
MNAGKLNTTIQGTSFPIQLDVEIYVNSEILNEEITLESHDDYLDYIEEVSSNILFNEWHYDFHIKTNKLNIN